MKDSIYVGMTAALTGRYSLPGRQALLGAQAWVEDTNRAGGIWLQSSRRQLPVRLMSYDDASEPETCAVLIQRLITDDQVDILLGPYSSGFGAQSRRGCPALAACAVESWWRFRSHLHTRLYLGSRDFVSPSTYFHSVIDFCAAHTTSASHVAIIHSTAGAFPQDVAAGAAQYGQQQVFGGRSHLSLSCWDN